MPLVCLTFSIDPPHEAQSRGWSYIGVVLSAADLRLIYLADKFTENPPDRIISSAGGAGTKTCLNQSTYDNTKLNSIWQRKHRWIGHVLSHDGLNA